MAIGKVKIVEQPAERAIRFRHDGKGRNNRTIVGVNSTRDKPSYPKIRVNNYTGTVRVTVTCVTNESR